MLTFREMPNGQYEPNITRPEIFELIIAVANFMESYDQSSSHLVDKLLLDESLQPKDMVKLISEELAELADTVDLNVPFTCDGTQSFFHCIPFESDDTEDPDNET